jgi:hypothetical protein
VVTENINSKILAINGSKWNNAVKKSVYVLDLNQRSSEKVLELPWSAYAEAGGYYKNSVFIFGGGSASRDGAIHLTRSVDRFY